MDEAKVVQKMEDGAGCVYHRTYTVDLDCSWEDALSAMKRLQGDPNDFSPQSLAKFEKRVGDLGSLLLDHEFMIHISGPWNGPVRVAEVSPESFLLSTLEGHMEAGEIRFSILRIDGRVAFQIESYARSSSFLVDLVYDKIPFARFMQTKMWELVCEEFMLNATHTERDLEDEDDSIGKKIVVKTEKRDKETGQWHSI